MHRLDLRNVQVERFTLMVSERALRQRLERDVTAGLRQADVIDRSVQRLPLYEKMKNAGVYGRRYFYPLISTFSTYRGLDSAGKDNLPEAYKMAERVICLPMHHALSEDDVERVIGQIIE